MHLNNSIVSEGLRDMLCVKTVQNDDCVFMLLASRVRKHAQPQILIRIWFSALAEVSAHETHSDRNLPRTIIVSIAAAQRPYPLSLLRTLCLNPLSPERRFI
jgi:hypothetical protein